MSLPVQAQPPAKIIHVVSPLGIEASLVVSDIVPMIAMSFVFEGGAARDDVEKSGTAEITAKLLTEGAGAFSSDAYQEQLAAHAIDIEIDADRDRCRGTLKTLIKYQDKAFEFLRLALVEPRFDEDAIERVRAQCFASLRYSANDPNDMTERALYAHAFGEHAYARSPDLGSVAFIQRHDIVKLHKVLFTRERLKIAVVGDISPDQLGQILDQVFGDLPAVSGLAPLGVANQLEGRKRIVLDLDVPQSTIRFCLPAMLSTHPNHIAGNVLNHILGGGVFTSRLFNEIREKRGLAYSANSHVMSSQTYGYVLGYTATKNERVVECLDVIDEQLQQLRDVGPSEQELFAAKNYLVGSFPLHFDTSPHIASHLTRFSFDGMGDDYISRRNEMMKAVTLDQVRMAADHLLSDGRMVTVIAGRPVGIA